MDRYLTILLRGLFVTCIGLNTALSAADEEVAVNGRNVRKVSTGDYGATFVNVEGRIWHELREDGSLAFEFTEGGRDEWSVYLADESRDAGLQIDLWTKDIRLSEKGLPASVLARVYEAFADPSAEPTGEAYNSDGSTFVLAKIDEAFASISPEDDDGIRREWADRAYGLRGSQDDYVRVMESDEPEEEYHAIEREFGREEGVEPGRTAGFDHGGRGAKMPTDIPPLSIDEIVEWAQAYKEEHNKWPRASSGLVEGVPHKMTWAMVNSALSKGLGGLSGGSSLAEMLEQHFEDRRQCA